MRQRPDPLRVFIAGQKQFGRDVLAALLDHPRYDVVGVSAPMRNSRGDNTDRLRDLALERRLPVQLAGAVRAETLPDGLDLIIAAHAHDYLGRRVRARARFGAIGYHPSLLPRHRGRDAVRWAVHMGDVVAGGTVFWLSDAVDAGEIAAQHWCWIRPDDTAETLWRRELAPMGVQLLQRVLQDVDRGVLIRVPQDPTLATWEPSWERPPLHRPDLPLLGDGRVEPFTVLRDRAALDPR